MPKSPTATYSSLNPGPSQQIWAQQEKKKVSRGIKIPLRIPLILIYTYALAMVGFIVWVLVSPSQGVGMRALRTGNLKVNQFYSGVILSVFFTPAAITIRRIAHDLGLLYPFLVSSRKAVSMKDIDTMMDPGIRATMAMSKYAPLPAVIQSLLLIAGAFLVPIGTLLVTTGVYGHAEQGLAVIGLPTFGSGMMTMEAQMGMGIFCGDKTVCYPELDDEDNFLMNAVAYFEGQLIGQLGVLATPPALLGPVTSSNITLEDGFTYTGIVTYEWASNCAPATGVSWSEVTTTDDWSVNFTFPDGSIQGNDVYDGKLFMWSTSDIFVNTSATGGNAGTIPIGGQTYLAVAGTMDGTKNITEAEALSNNITFTNGVWISVAMCTPTFSWQVSTCTRQNGSWAACSAAPGQNTTELDNRGLGALQYYMTGLPFMMHNEPTYVYNREPLLTALIFDPTATTRNAARIPLIPDFDRIYGVVANALATTSLGGYYGTAEVPVTGARPQPAYLVRTYILAIVAFILMAVPLMTTLFVAVARIRHLPLRPARFLTIASAVRGVWWDRALWGGNLLTAKELRRRYSDKCIQFASDETLPGQVGVLRAAGDQLQGWTPDGEVPHQY